MIDFSDPIAVQQYMEMQRTQQPTDIQEEDDEVEELNDNSAFMKREVEPGTEDDMIQQ